MPVPFVVLGWLLLDAIGRDDDRAFLVVNGTSEDGWLAAATSEVFIVKLKRGSNKVFRSLSSPRRPSIAQVYSLDLMYLLA